MHRSSSMTADKSDKKPSPSTAVMVELVSHMAKLAAPRQTTTASAHDGVPSGSGREARGGGFGRGGGGGGGRGRGGLTKGIRHSFARAESPPDRKLATESVQIGRAHV